MNATSINRDYSPIPSTLTTTPPIPTPYNAPSPTFV